MSLSCGFLQLSTCAAVSSAYDIGSMKVVSVKRLSLILAACCAFLCIGVLSGRAESSPLPVKDIIQKAVARAGKIEAASKQPGYTYTKCTVTEGLDASGNALRERKEEGLSGSFFKTVPPICACSKSTVTLPPVVISSSNRITMETSDN